MNNMRLVLNKKFIYITAILVGSLVFLSVTILPNLGNIFVSAHQPDLRVLKTANREVINPGDILTFTIGVTNIGDQKTNTGHNDTTAYNVSIVDNLPNGFVAVDGNKTSLSWHLAKLQEGETWTQSFDVKAQETIEPGGYLNIVTVNAMHLVNGSFVNYPQIQASWAVVVKEPEPQQKNPNLTVTKTADKNSLESGGSINYTITLKNEGEEKAKNVKVTDNLPAHFTHNNQSVVNWSVGDLQAGATWSQNIIVQVAPNAPSGNYPNQVSVTASNNSTVQATHTVQVVKTPDKLPVLSIQKITTGGSNITAGDSVTFTITVTNLGQGSAIDLTLVDILPAGFTASDTGNSTIQWSLAELKPGNAWVRTFSANTNGNLANGVYTNTATVSASNYKSLNSTASVVVQQPPVITQNPVLSIQKTVSPLQTNAGTTVNYTIVITNSGNGASLNTGLFDQLPSAGFTYADNGATTRTWDLGTIASGETRTINYAVNIAGNVSNGSYVNAATVSSKNHSPVSGTAVIQVQGEVLGDEFAPVLVIEKTANRQIANPGSQVIYTIKVTNTGEANAVNLTLKDLLPQYFKELNTANTVLEWTRPVLGIGEVWQVSYTVKIENEVTEGSYINSATVSAENHPNQVKDSYLIDVRKGTVLGDTGITPLQMFVWLISIGIFALALSQIRKKRLLAKQVV